MRVRVLGGVLAAVVATGVVPLITVTEATAREWDVGQYDACFDRVLASYNAGDITDANFIDATHQCCRLSGGEWDTSSGPYGNCGAPPAIVAPTASGIPENAPEEPVGSAPPTKPTKAPKTTLIPAPSILLPG